VAFTWDGESQDNRDIYVKAVGSEQPLRLTSDPAQDESPAWSPDGTQIAFLRDKAGDGSEVRLVPPTGGRERRLAKVKATAEQGPAWSLDGRWRSWIDPRPGTLRLFLLDIESGRKERLTTPPPLVRRRPAGFLRWQSRLQANRRESYSCSPRSGGRR
jgi:Tol biopolymer transport system component